MFQVFSRAQGQQPQLWAAVQWQRMRALFLPVRVRLFGRAFGRLSWSAVDFDGILYSPDGEGEHALPKLRAAFVRDAPMHVLFTKLRNTYDLQPVRHILESHGSGFEEHLSCFIEMRKSPDELWHPIRKSGRRALQKARIKRVITEEIQSQSMVLVHDGLLKRTFQRARVPLAQISLFEAVADVSVPAGMAKMFLARVDGQPAAAFVELPFNRVIYRWFSGHDPDFRKAYPNDHLVWHILK